MDDMRKNQSHAKGDRKGWIKRRVIYMPELWEEFTCRRVSMTKEEYNIHFEQVEWDEMNDRFRDGNIYGETGENIHQAQELPSNIALVALMTVGLPC
jgi:hypothetical protein